eukprot:TRINITY_DN1321_c0_g1_i3.p1 TRINITY_DN1321_c0_g1~~TRINITY_DN1321_c0_g1_i3.p1  ORF type:complete len:245 (-),score=-2.34 TRINITY_DN1321_c0_g1_i3:399-1133(-)
MVFFVLELGFWANILLFIGSALWVVGPSMCYVTTSDSYCFYVMVAASICFVINGFLYLIEGFMVRGHRNYLPYYGGHTGRKTRCDGINWFVLAHLFFFLGAWGDLWSSCILSFDNKPRLLTESTLDNLDWAAFADTFASHTWLLGAVFSNILSYLDRKSRKVNQALIRFSLFPYREEEVDSEPHVTTTLINSVYRRSVNLCHFTGWADIVFLIGSFMYVAGSWVCWLDPEDSDCWSVQVRSFKS